MRPAFAALLAQVAGWFVLAQANHALSPWHICLFAGGLWVAPSALMLPFRPGFAAALVAGFIVDANSPVPFGTHALLFAAAQALLFQWRDHLPHDEPRGRAIIALLANLALIASLTIVMRPPGGSFPRLVADLAWSEALVLFACPWFFAFQEEIFLLIRGDRRERR